MRIATLVLCILDALGWAIIARHTLFGPSDPATMGLDSAFGWIVTALLLLTAGPAFALAMARRAPKTSFVLALAFPFGVAALVVAAVLYFTFIM
ncbi:MAG TPA: hypothetical protein VNK48_17175 [Xanthobacteraceae bacterium]|nr:hypothetical protein [Xanthobacteraceae bacterium]